MYHEGVPQEVICEVVGRSVNILDKPKSHTLHVQLLSISRLCDLRSWRSPHHPHAHKTHRHSVSRPAGAKWWGIGDENRSTRWITIGSQP